MMRVAVWVILIGLGALLPACQAWRPGGERPAFPPDLRYPLGESRVSVHRWLSDLQREGFWGGLPRAHLLQRSRSPFFDRELWCFPFEEERFLTLRYSRGQLIAYEVSRTRPDWADGGQ